MTRAREDSLLCPSTSYFGASDLSWRRPVMACFQLCSQLGNFCSSRRRSIWLTPALSTLHPATRSPQHYPCILLTHWEMAIFSASTYNAEEAALEGSPVRLDVLRWQRQSLKRNLEANRHAMIASPLGVYVTTHKDGRRWIPAKEEADSVLPDIFFVLCTRGLP